MATQTYNTAPPRIGKTTEAYEEPPAKQPKRMKPKPKTRKPGGRGKK